MANHQGLLERLGACREAADWYDGRDSEQAWAECERGDWMLWVAGKLNVDRKVLVAAACECAELALVHVPDGEDRPRQAIETARAWVSGNATLEQVRKAASAAYAAAYADAARAAAYAAYADATRAAASAADAAAYASRAKSLRRSAEIVRAHISWVVLHEAVEAVDAAERSE